MIVGLAGKAGHGKDTLGEIFCRRGNFIRMAYGDVLRDVAIASGIMSQEDLRTKSSHYRSTLQAGGHFVRMIDKDFWVNKLWASSEMIMHLDNGANIVVTDVRYVNEADVIVEAGGMIIRVVRVDDEGHLMDLLGGSQSMAPSEIDMDGYRTSTDFEVPDGRLDLMEEMAVEWMHLRGIPVVSQP